MRPPASSRTRDKLLFHLKTRGARSAADLARRLGITSMAVRQHLAALEEQGLVVFRDEAGRVGRPRRIWELTDAAQERFPENHAELALGLLGAARQAFGEEGLAALVSGRVKAQIAEYRPRMPPASAPLKDKLAALASIRRDEGYMAEWKARQHDLLLIENHCPICVAATACVGLCAGELELFRALLGPRVSVEREEYLLDGDRRCTYVIRPRGRGR